jgi:hypothetical protein
MVARAGLIFVLGVMAPVIAWFLLLVLPVLLIPALIAAPFGYVAAKRRERETQRERLEQMRRAAALRAAPSLPSAPTSDEEEQRAA